MRRMRCSAQLSALSGKMLSVRLVPVWCLVFVLRSCVADFCMFDRYVQHSLT